MLYAGRYRAYAYAVVMDGIRRDKEMAAYIQEMLDFSDQPLTALDKMEAWRRAHGEWSRLRALADPDGKKRGAIIMGVWADLNDDICWEAFKKIETSIEFFGGEVLERDKEHTFANPTGLETHVFWPMGGEMGRVYSMDNDD